MARLIRLVLFTAGSVATLLIALVYFCFQDAGVVAGGSCVNSPEEIFELIKGTNAFL